MSIFDYYFELLDKPKYMLSESESMFIELFPLVIISAVFIVMVLVMALAELINSRKK